MGQVRHRLDVEKSQLGVAGEFPVEKAGMPIDFGGPFVKVGGIQNPAAFDVVLLHEAFRELLIGSAVTLDGGDEIPGFVHVVLYLQERLHRRHDGGHSRGSRTAGCFAVIAVTFQ